MTVEADVVRVLVQSGPLTLGALSRRTGSTSTAILEALAELEAAGKVRSERASVRVAALWYAVDRREEGR